METERDLLIKLTARAIGSVTGTRDRDVHVITTMGVKHMAFPEMLLVRGPDAFPY